MFVSEYLAELQLNVFLDNTCDETNGFQYFLLKCEVKYFPLVLMAHEIRKISHRMCQMSDYILAF